MEQQHLNITPDCLKFRFELKKNIPVTLSLHNPGQERVAFKVKTTSPKKYCVRPSSGYVEPGATKDVQVIMQAQREYPPSLSDCKDKFLVQSVRVGADAPADVSPDLFDPAKAKEGSIKQTKLRVLLLGPPKPPSPVPEGVEEEGATPGRHAFKDSSGAGLTETRAAASGQENKPPGGWGAGGDAGTVLERERAQHRDALTQASNEKESLKKQLSSLQLQMQGRTTGGVTGRGLTAGGFTLIHLILIGFIAFLVGYFLR